jgi:hypothetical protein
MDLNRYVEPVKRALVRRAAEKEKQAQQQDSERQRASDEQALQAAEAERNRLVRALSEAQGELRNYQAAHIKDENTFREAERTWLFHSERYSRGLPALKAEVERLEAELKPFNDLLGGDPC